MQTRNKEQKWQYFLLVMVVLLTPMPCPASVVDVDGAASIGWSEVSLSQQLGETQTDMGMKIVIRREGGESNGRSLPG